MASGGASAYVITAARLLWRPRLSLEHASDPSGQSILDRAGMFRQHTHHPTGARMCVLLTMSMLE